MHKPYLWLTFLWALVRDGHALHYRNISSIKKISKCVGLFLTEKAYFSEKNFNFDEVVYLLSVFC